MNSVKSNMPCRLNTKRYKDERDIEGQCLHNIHVRQERHGLGEVEHALYMKHKEI